MWFILASVFPHDADDYSSTQLKSKVQELNLHLIELQEQLSGQASIMSASKIEFESRERLLKTDLEGAYRQNALLVEKVSSLQARVNEASQSSLHLQQAVLQCIHYCNHIHLHRNAPSPICAIGSQGPRLDQYLQRRFWPQTSAR